ncbi:xanthine dehydrogenase family protein molybdopterin-binding subunit, partial [Allosalinactinospora lopnorensis]|uniref:xanthine dehydrogenase family protein molybdopterin-binding subunit n=1 Tax=Allosalinactinospora lopnorensis TaxID=1352348 RepID=UPI000A5CB193
MIVRSPVAHARVRVIDAAGAAHVELLPPDRIVRYVGQPVLAVAAPTRAKAEAAAEQVAVDYHTLDPVLDPDRAAEPAASLVYPDRRARNAAASNMEGTKRPARWRGNVRGPAGPSLSWRPGTAMRRLTAARKRENPRLVTGVFSTPVQTHTPLEPHACLAYWDESGELHLYVSTQTIGMLAEQAAERWGLAPERVHVTAEHVGGGFGSKSGLTTETVAAVELAKAARAPVRVVLDRREELTDPGSRPGTRTALALLADENGDLAALSMDTYGEGGASVGSVVALWARLMYGHAPRRLRDFDTVTNHPPGTPFRAPGGPPMAWALEQAVDEMAHRLDEDPVALRRRWDGNPKRRALYDWAAALPAWLERPSPGGRTGRFRRGVGVAASNWIHQVDPGAEVELTVEQGAVVARTAAQDIGTGITSVLTDLLREELGLPPERIRVVIGHSGSVHGPASVGSRTTASLAPAAH